MPEYTRGQISRELEAGPRHPRVIANALGCSIADAGFQKTLRTLRNDGVIEYDKHSQMYSLVKPPTLNGKPLIDGEVGAQKPGVCPNCASTAVIVIPAHTTDGADFIPAAVCCDACPWVSAEQADIDLHWHHVEHVPYETAQEAAGDAHDDPPAETVAEDASEAPAYKGTRSAVVVDVLRKLIADGGEFNTEAIIQLVLAAVGGAKDDLDAKRWTGAVYNACHTAKRDGWLARSPKNKQGWWIGADADQWVKEYVARKTGRSFPALEPGPIYFSDIPVTGKPVDLSVADEFRIAHDDTPTDQVSDLMLRAMRVLVDRIAVKGIEAGENPDQWARALERLGDYVIGIDVARRSGHNRPPIDP